MHVCIKFMRVCQLHQQFLGTRDMTNNGSSTVGGNLRVTSSNATIGGTLVLAGGNAIIQGNLTVSRFYSTKPFVGCLVSSAGVVSTTVKPGYLTPTVVK